MKILFYIETKPQKIPCVLFVKCNAAKGSLWSEIFSVKNKNDIVEKTVFGTLSRAISTKEVGILIKLF